MGFGVGFDLMGRLFPLLFLIVFVFVISTIVGTFVSKAKRERKNDQSPRLTAEAKVVSKRMQVGENRHRHGNDDMMHSYNYSKYFVTFEFESGDRVEMPVDGSEYGLLVEGDTGKLTFPGHEIPRLLARITENEAEKRRLRRLFFVGTEHEKRKIFIEKR